MAARHVGAPLLLIALASSCQKPAVSPQRNSAVPEGQLERAAAEPTTPLTLHDRGYFARPGLNVMAFSDFYPEGHQGGVTIIQNGVRTAASGDVRLEPTPGQWQPVPKLLDRTVHAQRKAIVARLAFPDETKNRRGFNPVEYPDLEFEYSVTVEPDGQDFLVRVDLPHPLPEEWRGRVGFNLELFPGEYFGKTFLLGDQPGTFPRQVSGPLADDGHGHRVSLLGQGRRLSVAPEEPRIALSIEALRGGALELYDGRAEHNNGWFVVRAGLDGKATDGALLWRVSASTLPGFVDDPVVHLSQVGYHPHAQKKAVIERDPHDTTEPPARLERILPNGKRQLVRETPPEKWGEFLRYDYRIFDFSDVRESGVYQLSYGAARSNVFRITPEIFDRGVWQPTLEYFLPVQMCHMRVADRYRVWHDHCHEDDARMAPTALNHFDGYVQGPQTLTHYKPGQHVPGLDVGGWHDAGDYDLRVESQMGTVRILSQIYEEFALDYDATRVDQDARVVELHQADGTSDVLQQIEHGLLSVLGGYDSLGRLYRGIIVPTNRQYVLLGDASAQTDGKAMSGRGAAPGMSVDDRWVFTEENPARQLEVAAGLFAASRALREARPQLSSHALRVATELLEHSKPDSDEARAKWVEALVERALSTREEQHLAAVVAARETVLASLNESGWVIGRLLPKVTDESFVRGVRDGMQELAQRIEQEAAETPFGVPYTPKVWGAGWGIQEFGVRQYFLHQGWPDLFSAQHMISALDFMLGNHPGKNTSSFVSGVGQESLTVAYGTNRAEWSYIPGGVGSGTALIRPDLPELKVWPFFWQQSEYVMGGGGSNFLFLALAAQKHFEKQ